VKRIYHRHEKCEEYEGGMWREVEARDRQRYIDDAAALMKDARRFGAEMQRAVYLWPNSCENSLTSTAVNVIAFLGHIGCCVGVGSPEHLTRLAWHTLSKAEQDEANRAAQNVFNTWKKTREDSEQCLNGTLTLTF
jgi:hypothetical protein